MEKNLYAVLRISRKTKGLESPFYGLGGQLVIADNITSVKCDNCSMQISKLINSCLRLLPSERPTAKEIISFANPVMKKNGNILRHNIPSNGTLKQSKAFHNTFCTSILEAMRKYRIAQSADNLLYGIIDDKGNVIVDFLYDKIHKLGEFCWPGPLSPQKVLYWSIL